MGWGHAEMEPHCLGLGPRCSAAGCRIIGNSLSLSFLSWIVIKSTPQSCVLVCVVRGEGRQDEMTLAIFFP